MLLGVLGCGCGVGQDSTGHWWLAMWVQRCDDFGERGTVGQTVYCPCACEMKRQTVPHCLGLGELGVACCVCSAACLRWLVGFIAACLHNRYVAVINVTRYTWKVTRQHGHGRVPHCTTCVCPTQQNLPRPRRPNLQPLTFMLLPANI